MKINNINDATSFLDAVDQCKHDVFLKSPYGDVYNIKSKLTQYLAIAELLGEHGDEMELFASCKEDEARLLNFFAKNPQMLGYDK